MWRKWLKALFLGKEESLDRLAPLLMYKQRYQFHPYTNDSIERSIRSYLRENPTDPFLEDKETVGSYLLPTHQGGRGLGLLKSPYHNFPAYQSDYPQAAEFAHWWVFTAPDLYLIPGGPDGFPGGYYAIYSLENTNNKTPYTVGVMNGKGRSYQKGCETLSHKNQSLTELKRQQAFTFEFLRYLGYFKTEGALHTPSMLLG